MNTTSSPHARLLSLRDVHGAPLADFDWYEPLDLLHVSWHGHLTAASLVYAAQAGLELAPFAGRALPRRLLNNHQQTSGTWDEAVPWLQYDWLPRVQARGLQLLAHLVPQEPSSPRSSNPETDEFAAALREVLRARSFKHVPPAWYWLTHR